MSERKPAAAAIAPAVRVVVMSSGELEELVERKMAAALDAQKPVSDWTDIEGIALHLVVSPPTIRKLLDEGMPCVFVGSHRRFSRSRVEAWLEAREQKAEAAE